METSHNELVAAGREPFRLGLLLMLVGAVWMASQSLFSTVAQAQEANAAAVAGDAVADAGVAAATDASEASSEMTPAERAQAAIKKKQAEAESSRTMDQLLDHALAGRKPLTLGKTKEAEKPKAPVVPQTPSLPVLNEIVKVVAPAIRACAKGQPGLAEMAIVVYHDGRVTHAKVTSPPFFGTPSGACMEGVVRRTHFPRFTQRQFRVTVPFTLQ